MNYEELKRANELVKRIREIDFHLKMTVRSTGNIKIRVNSHVMVLDNEYKQRFDKFLKEFRNELVKELKELGVTEV